MRVSFFPSMKVKPEIDKSYLPRNDLVMTILSFVYVVVVKPIKVIKGKELVESVPTLVVRFRYILNDQFEIMYLS